MKRNIGLLLIACCFLSLQTAYSSQTFAEEKADVNSEQKMNELKQELEQAGVKGDNVPLTADGQLPDALIDLVINFVFLADNPILNFNENIEISENPEEGSRDWYTKNWYQSLDNISIRTIETTETYHDSSGNQVTHPIKLTGRYIDNKSDTTAILHHGYRANWNDLIRQAKIFAEDGFNVLIISSRGLNGSEGKYLSFGYYEQDDLNLWIDNEVNQTSSDQRIILMGLSMGASVTMMSQKNPHPNVAAYIEDSGYDVLFNGDTSGFDEVFEQFPFLDFIDPEQLAEQVSRRTKALLGFRLEEIAPIDSLQNSIPKLFIHGRADTGTPVSVAEELYAKSQGYKELLTVEGAEHAASYEADPELYTQTLQAFLDKVLSRNISSFNQTEQHILTGQTVDTLNLPKNVTMTLDDGRQQEVSVSKWDTKNYDEKVPGKYTFTGEIENSDVTIKNPKNLQPTVTIISHPRPEKISILNNELEISQGNQLSINSEILDGNQKPITDSWITNQIKYQLVSKTADLTNNPSATIDETGLIDTQENTATGDYILTILFNEEIKKEITVKITSNGQNLYRLYNPNTGEHFYTLSTKEKNHLISIGWHDEKNAWMTPTSGKEVWRLYNPNSGEHFYTANKDEYNQLGNIGWRQEGIAFYSAESNGQPIYRVYNKNQTAFNHHYTSNVEERDHLLRLDWQNEGVAFYGK
ncbi:Ig-like domain-containing protein [Enterococcus sp. AZ103]|uniref:Ig-like domain-containing protein n=1 Tax=Enterococcus sp. AZ103 TaxID=2774628 RepID=UPI003F2337C0